MNFDSWCLQWKVSDQERMQLASLLISIRIRRLIDEQEPLAVIYIRTLVAEAERTGSWHVPPELQERMTLFVKGWLPDREVSS